MVAEVEALGGGVCTSLDAPTEDSANNLKMGAKLKLARTVLIFSFRQREWV
eukprot:CAMPEP_0119070796 /NCGR_PEP_ID=MMETSP1178-20130426/42950_1 /TAXON_ID=33656 /ORGANISM="unid sp, Strain CCMP2000" /LENGTH=50 /DNA_ID=CAMNT_0007052669 /DNA_START=103 /DNA_END=255 /DNA_ORIENTATION=+